MTRLAYNAGFYFDIEHTWRRYIIQQMNISK